MYLLPIFSSKDIVAQLPEEGILFFEVDATFRKSMTGVFREPRVRETAGSVCIYSIKKFSNLLITNFECLQFKFVNFPAWTL